MTTITDQWGRVSTFSYTGGMVTSITDFDGAVTTYGYSNGRLTSINQPDPDGAGPLTSPVTTYQYYASGAHQGLLEKITDPRGQETLISYDHARRVSAIEHADGGVVELDAYQSQSVIDQSVHGDTSGNPAPLSAVALETMQERREDERGNETYVKRDRFGNIVEFTDALGNVTTYVRNADGLVTTMTQPDPDGAGPLTNLVTVNSYDNLGNLTHRVNPDGGHEDWDYQSSTGWLIQYTDPENRVTWYDLDTDGNVLSMTQVVGLDDRYFTDAEVDITTAYTYTDGTGNVPAGLLETVTDAEGRVTAYDYAYNTGADELTVTITYAGGTADETVESYHYDAANNLLYLIDGLGRQTDYEYDALSQLVKRTDPDPDGAGPQARPVWKYKYDANSNLIQQTDRWETSPTTSTTSATGCRWSPIPIPTAPGRWRGPRPSTCSISTVT